MTHFSTVKRVIALAGAGAMLFSVAACGGGTASGGGKTTLKFAAFEGGYGADMYKEVVAAYEKLNPDVKIELTTSKKIEDEITPGMKAGNYPDIVELGQGSTSGLTETLLKDKAIEDVTDVLDMKVPGENKTVKDKLVDGVIGLYTNPYGGDKTYLMPMYYSPSGLVYNKTLLEQNGWKMPTTWDEMFKLGDEAKAKGISLFTYPTAGYFDAFFNALLADIGGDQFYQDVMTYKKDVWKTDEAKEALETTYKLVTEYLNPDTVGYANGQDFTKNQQSVQVPVHAERHLDRQRDEGCAAHQRLRVGLRSGAHRQEWRHPLHQHHDRSRVDSRQGQEQGGGEEVHGLPVLRRSRVHLRQDRCHPTDQG